MLKWFNNNYKNVPKEWNKNQKHVLDTALCIYFILVMKHLNYPISKDVIRYLCCKYLTVWYKKYVESYFLYGKRRNLYDMFVIKDVMSKRTNVIDFEKASVIFDICYVFLDQGQRVFFCYQNEQEEEAYPIYLELSNYMGYELVKKHKYARDGVHFDKIRWGLYKDYGKIHDEQHTFTIVYGTDLKQNTRLFKKIKNNTRCCGLLIVNIK